MKRSYPPTILDSGPPNAPPRPGSPHGSQAGVSRYRHTHVSPEPSACVAEVLPLPRQAYSPSAGTLRDSEVSRVHGNTSRRISSLRAKG